MELVCGGGETVTLPTLEEAIEKYRLRLDIRARTPQEEVDFNQEYIRVATERLEGWVEERRTCRNRNLLNPLRDVLVGVIESLFSFDGPPCPSRPTEEQRPLKRRRSQPGVWRGCRRPRMLRFDDMVEVLAYNADEASGRNVLP